MKVLLFITNTHLWRSVGRALLIWLITGILGCLIFYGVDSRLLPLVKSIILSLVFSSPAVVIAVPLLYHLYRLPSLWLRLLVSLATILIVSACIIAIVSIVFSLYYTEVAEALLPFIPAAFVCFLLVAHKQLTKSYPV